MDPLDGPIAGLVEGDTFFRALDQTEIEFDLLCIRSRGRRDRFDIAN